MMSSLLFWHLPPLIGLIQSYTTNTPWIRNQESKYCCLVKTGPYNQWDWWSSGKDKQSLSITRIKKKRGKILIWLCREVKSWGELFVKDGSGIQ